MWTRGNVLLIRSGGRTMVYISDLEFLDGEVPSGKTINPEITNRESKLNAELTDVMAFGGEIHLGSMRVLNGGGILQIEGDSALQLSSPGRCLHTTANNRIWPTAKRYLDSKPTSMLVAVIRDWAAPFTHGVIDGGGTGRGDSVLTSMQDFLINRCLNELVTEIGILVDTNQGAEGWVGYTFEGNGHELQKALIGQWTSAHRHLPGVEPIATLNLSLLPLPDRLEVEGWEDNQLNNVSISIEPTNASLEVVVAAKGRFDHLPSDSHLRFIDLEISDIGALNRRVAVILLGNGGKRLLVTYKDGSFDPTLPLIPLPDESLGLMTNAKLATVIKYL